MGTSPYIHDPSHESHVTSHESHGEREKKRKRIMDIEWFVTSPPLQASRPRLASALLITAGGGGLGNASASSSKSVDERRKRIVGERTRGKVVLGEWMMMMRLTIYCPVAHTARIRRIPK